jgi:hypothetical protein
MGNCDVNHRAYLPKPPLNVCGKKLKRIPVNKKRLRSKKTQCKLTCDPAAAVDILFVE